MRKLLVVQPYVPEYRVPFFNLLREGLLANDIELTLAAGQPDRAQAHRADAREHTADVTTSSRSLAVRGRRVRWQWSWTRLRDHDAVVVEASGALLDSTAALLHSSRVGLWGHIDGFVNSPHRLDGHVEKWQLNRAEAVFAYTNRGAAKAVELGVDASRVIVLNNTVDTAGVRAAAAAMTPAEAYDLLGITDWTRRPVFAFIGGLDDAKRPEFLASALDRLHQTHPMAKLVVAGAGEGEWHLRAAVDRGQVRVIGRGGTVEKAALSHVALGILMPGRVGLVAVDSFALGLPIITTDWPWHAPEFEYLTPGIDAVVAKDDVEEYAAAIACAIDYPTVWDQVRANAASKAGQPSLEAMVSNFVGGAEMLLASRRPLAFSSRS